MSELISFANRLKERLADANREPHWEPGEADRYMADVGVRRERFAQLANRLGEEVIRPRLETLASFFANAVPAKEVPVGHCSCWFGYCERFPTSTRIAFSVDHDVSFEKVTICYEACIKPVFIKLNERDKLTMPIDEVSDEVVADWVEERLFEFLEAYMQIDRGGDEFEEDVATDPVCGMRISRSSAAAYDNYRGHPYFFCSTECRDRFAAEPTAFVAVKAR